MRSRLLILTAILLVALIICAALLARNLRALREVPAAEETPISSGKVFIDVKANENDTTRNDTVANGGPG